MSSSYDNARQTGYTLERAIFETLVPELEADGFRVFIHPTKTGLPEFLRGYVPGIIAYKEDKKLAIEVLDHTDEKKETLLRDRFEGHPEWELRFIYALPNAVDPPLPIVSRDVILQSLNANETGLDAMGTNAALLTAWAALEAAARYHLPAHFERSATGSRLIETLASMGCVTPDEADALRRLSLIRNQVAHGRIDLVPSRDDVLSLVDITREVLLIPTTEHEPE